MLDGRVEVLDADDGDGVRLARSRFGPSDNMRQHDITHQTIVIITINKPDQRLQQLISDFTYT